MLTIALSAIAALLMLGPLGAVPSRVRAAGSLVYGACAVLSTVLLAAGCGQLLAGGGSPELVLPLGLPWIGAHFRADALASAFLVVVNLGGAAASLFAIGYGHHEEAPQRVLPFYPLFIAGMNLVVLAADAFTFLLSWEFMSLASWALVLRGRRPDQVRPRRLFDDGGLRDAVLAARLWTAGGDRRRLRFCRHARRPARTGARCNRPHAGSARHRIEGRARSAACLAALGPSGGAKPCLGADERRHDQSRRLRFCTDRVRPAWAARLVVEHGRAELGRRDSGARGSLCADAARFEAAARVSHGREHRHHLHRTWPRARVQGQRNECRCRPSNDRRALPRAEPHAV